MSDIIKKRRVLMVTDHNLFTGDFKVNTNSRCYSSLKRFCHYNHLSDKTYSKIGKDLREKSNQCIYEAMFIYRMELI